MTFRPEGAVGLTVTVAAAAAELSPDAEASVVDAGPKKEITTTPAHAATRDPARREWATLTAG